MDDGRDAGTVMFLQGRVSGPDGQPLAGAIVDVWHANTQGTYSYFDSSQSEYNLRRASAPTPTAATVRAASCRPATVARATARPRNCSTASAATASGRRTFTSSSRRPAIAT